MSEIGRPQYSVIGRGGGGTAQLSSTAKGSSGAPSLLPFFGIRPAAASSRTDL